MLQTEEEAEGGCRITKHCNECRMECEQPKCRVWDIGKL